jgi:hypothetical protein
VNRREVQMTGIRAGAATAAVGLGVTALSPVASADVNQIIKDANDNASRYVVYRQNDAKLSFGNDIGANFSGTDIFMTVVKENDLGGADPQTATKAILNANPSRDTVIMVVKQNNGTDKIVASSNLEGFANAVTTITGTEVKDAGDTLYNSSGRILARYKSLGGDVSGKSVGVLNQYNNTVSSNIDKAVNAQDKYTVYKMDGTTLDQGQEVADALGNSDVKVTVVPQSAAPDDTAASIAERIASNSSHGASIVVLQGRGNGKETIAVASSNKEMAAKLGSIIPDNTQVEAGKSGEWLMGHASSITGAVSQVHAQAAAAKQKADEEAKEFLNGAIELGLSLVGVVVIVATLGAGIKSFSDWMSKREDARKAAEEEAEKERLIAEEKAKAEEAERERLGGKSKKVDTLLTALKKTIPDIDAANTILKSRLSKVPRKNVDEKEKLAAIQEATESIRDTLGQLIKAINRLYATVQEQGQEQELPAINTEIEDQLTRVLNIVGKRALQSFVRKPENWESPDKKARAVADVLEKVVRTLNQRIVNINESGTFNLNVDMEMLSNNSSDDESVELLDQIGDLSGDTMEKILKDTATL